jgi:hypothetical protein
MTVESFIHPAAIAVQVGKDWKFFNPGVNFLPYGSLIWYEEDVWALIIGEKQFSWERTPMTDVDKSIAKRTGKLKLSEDGTLEGTIRTEYFGQPAVTSRLQMFEDSADKREENFREELNGASAQLKFPALLSKM